MRLALALLVLGAGVAHALSGAANESAVRDGKVHVGCADNTVMCCLDGRSGGQTITLNSDAGGSGTVMAATTGNATLTLSGNLLGDSGFVQLYTPNLSIFSGNSGAATNINLFEAGTNGTDYVTLKVPASIAAPVGFTLPGTAPTTVGMFLTATTGGVMSFSAFPTAAAIAGLAGGL